MMARRRQWRHDREEARCDDDSVKYKVIRLQWSPAYSLLQVKIDSIF